MKRAFALPVLLSLLTGCASLSSTPTATATLPPTAETPSTLPEPTDNTQLLVIPSGQAFDIVVPSNPSTGYHWNIIPELDANLIEFVSQSYIAEQPVAPGSGGVDVWTFRALSAGETTIVLGYYPPDNDADPEEVVTFSIRVE